MTTVLLGSRHYRRGLSRRQLVMSLEVDVFLDLCYTQLVHRVAGQMGAESSYDEAKIAVDKKFYEMRPRTRDQVTIERANRILNNVRALGAALGGN